MDLSIIIPSYKRADLLEHGLKSLTQQKITCQYEVIVLNDGIQDDTQKVCDSYKDRLNIRYVFTGHRNTPEPVWRIPGFAINIGAKLARGTYMIIMCPEIYIMDNCVQGIVDALNNSPKRVVTTRGKDDQNELFLRNVRVGLLPGNLVDLYNTLPILNTGFPFFMGLYTKEFIEIGGYDEDFIGNCWDDQDFITRLRQNGAIWIALEYRIVHLYHSRFRYDNVTTKKMWDYNKRLYDERLGQIKRNVGKEWGSCPPGSEVKEMNELERYFTSIYEKNTWHGKESRSGTGSDLSNTQALRPQLVDLINSLHIDSMLDLPCGDFNWMKEIITKLQIMKYVGADIIPAMIKSNTAKYGNISTSLLSTFAYLNMIDTIPPKVDLILCRDGLVHLSYNSVRTVLKNFIASGSTYVIMSTFTDIKREYPDIKDGEWRAINFSLAPFYFPRPLCMLNEGCTEDSNKWTDKSLGLWRLSDLRAVLDPNSKPTDPSLNFTIATKKPEKPSKFVYNTNAKIKVVHIHPWWDSAGVGILHAEMMNKYTNVGVRHVVSGVSVLKHNTDLMLGHDDNEIKKTLKEADILHFNTFWHDDPQLKGAYTFPWADYLPGKKLIFHMHGGAICFNYRKLEEISKVATMYTCSPLLPQFMHFTTWVPNIIPIYDPLYTPKSHVSKKPIRLLFMVNHDHNKGRAEIDWLLTKLNTVYGHKISFESWIQKYPYREALIARKNFDIVIDNITQGFIGMVGWETLCQAQVCLARLSPIVLESYTKLGNGEIPPIVNVSGIDELAKEIVDLSEDEERVRHIQKCSREWIEHYYNPERLCKLWEKRYAKLL